MSMRKVNIEKLRLLHGQGLTNAAIAKELGVHKSNVSRQLKKLGVAAVKSVVVEQAPKVVAQSLDTVEQLTKINEYANELLDLLMKWNRGEAGALQVLESAIKTKKIRIGKEERFIEEVKFKDPRELAVKLMAEIRGQLSLQNEMFETLVNIEIFVEYHALIIEFLRRIDPKLRDEFLAMLQESQALRRALRAKPIKPFDEGE